jgi:lipoprotein NlpD
MGAVTRAIRIVGLCCVLLSGCADTGGAERATYIVRPQDSLYSIAWRHDLDFRDLARWNHIGPDYRIAVGQTLVLRPTGEVAVPATQRSALAMPSAGATTAAPKPVPQSRLPRAPDLPQVSKPTRLADAAATPAPEPAGPAASIKWVWPTDRTSAPRPVPGGGILLLGRLGQEVRAASAGRVVYIGSGLRGYGKLIIIKHGESLLSAYAHNREFLVHEGQEVVAGEGIARMGEGPHQVAALYFEIRQNGKPIDPLPYLGR